MHETTYRTSGLRRCRLQQEVGRVDGGNLHCRKVPPNMLERTDGNHQIVFRQQIEHGNVDRSELGGYVNRENRAQSGSQSLG